MKYTIKYQSNGRNYENIYVPTVDFLSNTISDIAYDALMNSLEYNNLVIKDNCIRNIELFKEDVPTPIYTALTYTEGMGFLLEAEDE